MMSYLCAWGNLDVIKLLPAKILKCPTGSQFYCVPSKVKKACDWVAIQIGTE